jgi:molybdate transport system ATP-binding protein
MASSVPVRPGDLFIQLTQVTFTPFQKPPLQNINWDIKSGEIWTITGNSGAGKTTLAECLAGKHPVKAGYVKYFFLPPSANSWEIKKHVAFLSFQPQEPGLNYARFYYQQRYNSSDTEGIKTVQEYLEENSPGEQFQPDDWERIIKVLQLQDLLSLEVIKLSNGQTRKMLIAQALLRHPKLLILDNPFIGLDKQTRREFTQMLRSLALHGTQIILVTSPTQIPEMVTHVLELQNFKVNGLFTRSEFLQAKSESSESPEIPNPATEEIFNANAPVPDFAIAVKFTDTSIQYDGNIILNKINWTVNTGEKWALLGPNGSGKTTLLSLINGDNPQAFANKIILFDRPKGKGESIWDIKKRIGFVSPEMHLYFRHNLTCATVAATGFHDKLFLQRRLTPAEEEQIHKLFSYYDFEHLQNKSFLQVSASEQRVVLIIRSLVKNPEMLIWDEPYQGLNDALINKIQALLSAYATPDKTIIFVSHYEKEIPPWINKRIYLENGQIRNLLI